jgi:hypothetical protein
MTPVPRSLSVVLLLADAVVSAQRAPIQQQLVFAPYHATGIYDLGETVGWTVMPGPGAPAYAFKRTARRNNAVVLKEGRRDLSSGTDKIELTGDQPEMIYVAVEPYAPLAAETPAPQSAAAGAAGYAGGNTGRNNGLYA